jgi:hypothetical protein
MDRNQKVRSENYPSMNRPKPKSKITWEERGFDWFTGLIIASEDACRLDNAKDTDTRYEQTTDIKAISAKTDPECTSLPC